MIFEHKKCRNCQNEKLVKNGKTATGKQKFYCQNCKSYGTFDSSRRTQEEKDEILNTYKERSSLRGLQRIYGVSPNSVIRWIKKKSI